MPIGNLPQTKNVINTNFCEIGFAKEENSNWIKIFVAIDNLIKGAVGQAVQNMNLMFGFDETEGLLWVDEMGGWVDEGMGDEWMSGWGYGSRRISTGGGLSQAVALHKCKPEGLPYIFYTLFYTFCYSYVVGQGFNLANIDLIQWIQCVQWQKIKRVISHWTRKLRDELLTINYELWTNKRIQI